MTEDSFCLETRTPPVLPMRGKDEDINDVYKENDFEILGV
jgi:hypothetical protein